MICPLSFTLHGGFGLHVIKFLSVTQQGLPAVLSTFQDVAKKRRLYTALLTVSFGGCRLAIRVPLASFDSPPVAKRNANNLAEPKICVGKQPSRCFGGFTVLGGAEPGGANTIVLRMCTHPFTVFELDSTIRNHDIIHISDCNPWSTVRY